VQQGQEELKFRLCNKREFKKKQFWGVVESSRVIEGWKKCVMEDSSVDMLLGFSKEK
jgi:hypothetical protein